MTHVTQEADRYRYIRTLGDSTLDAVLGFVEGLPGPDTHALANLTALLKVEREIRRGDGSQPTGQVEVLARLVHLRVGEKILCDGPADGAVTTKLLEATCRACLDRHDPPESIGRMDQQEGLTPPPVRHKSERWAGSANPFPCGAKTGAYTEDWAKATCSGCLATKPEEATT